MRRSGIVLLLLAAAVLSRDAAAIKDKDNQGRWGKPATRGPDAEVPGFLVNLGPTGARAILAERSFVVRYLFKESPSDGRLRLGDVVTGAFGKPFSAHTFGGGPHGYEGPIFDLGEAIERAEGKDGRLLLNVLRGGATVEVEIPLEAIGRFAPTFPYQCGKSELLRGRALKYLAARPEAATGGVAHQRSMATLALLTSGDPAQEAQGRRAALAWNQIPEAGTWTWWVSYQLITLAEYHLLTGDAAVLPTIRALKDLLRKDQYDGRIVCWPGKPGEDLERLQKHQQMYAGGFGHGPYRAALNSNGYGPMQYTTILAVIGWQLAERCGVAADPRGVKNAFEFIHHGTNEAGYVAYGGEFTLNNGFVDPVAWKKSRGGDNYVGRAGASLIAHKLAPDQPESAAYFEKNKGYLKSAYKSLPDGHACSMLGMAWGLLGSAASEDEGVLRTMLDYHKAWFNMMRCHDGSFVVLPGRDYADDGYYHSSRYNPTAIMALLFGLAYPKLQIQGIEVSIPGVNPKALPRSLEAAYRAVKARSYGEASRLARAAGAEGVPVEAWLDARAKKTVGQLRELEMSGRWVRLQERITALKPTHAGMPAYDEAVAAWEARLKGSPILAADKLLLGGMPGKALAALGASEEPAAKAVEARIRATADELLARWESMEKAAEWHGLKKELESKRELFRGIEPVDRKAADLEARLAGDAGRTLVEADRRLSEGAPGPALTALGATESPALRARAAEAERAATAALAALEQAGRWASLKADLSKARPKMAGLADFDARARLWESFLKTPEGAAAAAAEIAFQKGNLGAAAKGAAPALRSRVEEAAREALEPLEALREKGDWYGLSRELALLRRKLAGIPSFEEKDAAWQAAFKSEPGRTGLRLGAIWARLKESGKKKDVEAFLQQAGDGYYAREAKALLPTLK